MFSSDALIQLVFANTNDLYYAEDLLTLDLEDYLWHELREKFNIVYFVRMTDGKNVEVHSVDSKAQAFGGSFLYGKAPRAFVEWMIDRLQKESCAFVFEDDELENITSGRKEAKLLSRLPQLNREGQLKGTMVVVTSPVINQSRRFLLESPVFESLEDRTVLDMRGEDTLKNMYAFLKSRKMESCVFLNLFDERTIRAMLTHICFLFPERFVSMEEMNAAVKYLSQYLNNQHMQITYPRLFDKDFPLIHALHRDIYQQLLRGDIWEELVRRVRAIKGKLAEIEKEYYVDTSCLSYRICYQKETVEQQCMQLCVPGARYSGVEDEQVHRMLCEIYGLCISPVNSNENAEIEKWISDLLIRYADAGYNQDGDTCRRILSLVLFCLKWRYVSGEKEQSVLKVLQTAEDYIKASQSYFRIRKEYAGTLAAQSFGSVRKKLGMQENCLKLMDGTIATGMLNLSLNDSAESFTGLMLQMKSQLEDLDRSAVTEVEDGTTDIYSEETMAKMLE